MLVNSENIGTILCSVPMEQADYAAAFCDTISASSGVGFYDSPQHYEFVTKLEDAAGSLLLEGDHPEDALTGDSTNMAVTGVGWHVDSEMTFMRTSDVCGVFFFREDGHTRLTGESLEVDSLATHWSSGVSVYECFNHRQEIIYPWEGIGQTTLDLN